MDPTQLTIAEASRAVADGSLSPVALTEAYLERIAALDGELHSYVLVLRDAALEAARSLAAAGPRGPLHGIPIGLKDIYKTRGIRTTAGSRRLSRPYARRGRRNLGEAARCRRDPARQAGDA